MSIHYRTLRNKTELNNLKDLINSKNFVSGDIDDFIRHNREEIGGRIMTFEIRTLKRERKYHYIFEAIEYVFYRYSKHYNAEIELGRLVISGIKKTFGSRECNIPLRAYDVDEYCKNFMGDKQQWKKENG